MGLLKCLLFQTPEAVRDRLEQCALNDSDHITPGSRGDHVKKIGPVNFPVIVGRRQAKPDG